MSWLFSQALVAGFSEGNSLDGEPSVQLSVMPTPQRFWRNDKMTEFSILSRFGLTYALLTESRGAELLTWFRAGFPAKTYPSQAEAQDLKESEAAFGAKWRGSLAKYDRNSSSWKTAQCSLIEDSGEFSETWPRWGSMRNGELYLLPTLVRPTCEKGSGLLPTPAAWDATRTASSDPANLYKTKSGSVRRRSGANKSSNCGLSGTVAWPTPLARDSRTVKGGGAINEGDWFGAPDNAGSGSGESDRWPAEPGVGRMVDGLAYGMDRLKALGNGQVPRVAATAWRTLIDLDKLPG